ncbi:hypothetical protein BDZ45DRAFT_499328 [Acephala macrosclerotiorum]|nr:hypothetical protein BDZ45DRAFT_499328 [Acephala macrosclerotiorum]
MFWPAGYILPPISIRSLNLLFAAFSSCCKQDRTEIFSPRFLFSARAQLAFYQQTKIASRRSDSGTRRINKVQNHVLAFCYCKFLQQDRPTCSRSPPTTSRNKVLRRYQPRLPKSKLLHSITINET